MKKIKEYKGIIIIVLVILGAFYWFQIKPNQEKKEILANNKQCQQDGLKLFNEYKDNNPDSSSNGGFLPPEFHFDKELNTCLYKGSSIIFDNKGGAIQVFSIKDVYTNSTIVSYIEISSKDGEVSIVEGVGNKENYELMNNKYFIK